jgi:hypothetical protein
MYAQLEKIWNMVKTSREAEPFILPVTDDIAPDYSQIIARPMDLSTMETKLLERDYRNKFEFIDDMNLIFLNCLAYNGLENGTLHTYNRSFIAFLLKIIQSWRNALNAYSFEHGNDIFRHQKYSKMKERDRTKSNVLTCWAL